MPILARLAAVTILALLATGAARAGESEVRHAHWRGCLDRAFAAEALLTGRDLAADAALRACRGAEEAYLAALAASPLLDAADLARARPALAARARGWLLGVPGAEPRAALR